MPLRNLAWLLAVPAVVLVGLAISYSAPAPDKDYRLVRQVVDVLAEVDGHYYRELTDEDKQQLVEDMINGGLRALDPHSEYLNEKKLKEFETSSEGHFGGVGITLDVDKKWNVLKVEHPMPGTPAYHAGVVAGDLIVKVNGESTEGLDIPAARKKITGPVGSKVVLTMRREGRTPPEQDVELTRGKIEIHPVAGVRRRADDPTKWDWFLDPENKIALIHLVTFNEITMKELRAAVAEIDAAGGRGIILDLRDNPGGLLNQAIDVCDLFLSEGKIVSTRDRRNNERSFSAKKDDKDYVPRPGAARPMAVLVNRHSASASEIVAAALQDHDRAAVVGERTYGKGSVQKLLRVPNTDPPAAIKLTTETYWRPSNKNIHRSQTAKEADEWGVRPSAGCEVPTTEEERLRYMVEMKKLEFVAGKPGAVGPNPAVAKTPLGADGRPLVDETKPFEDRVLQKGVEVLRRKLSGTGAAPAAPPPAGVPMRNPA
jgi:carboxyl-terminal processing protease